ncbi:MAG: hypothetical protein JST00_28630 [Deltaproteobacteria bacterium]|nr:hypothetical protein [Deltaproteobacteria bacterium]
MSPRLASIPVFEEEPSSETGILIRDALACVRQVARLEDRVVLPPLPAATPRTTRVVLSRDVVAAANDVAPPSPPAVSPVAVAVPAPVARAAVATSRGPSRAPIVLCALVAIASAVGSFFASPVAHRQPIVRAAMNTVEQRAAAALTYVHSAID